MCSFFHSNFITCIYVFFFLFLLFIDDDEDYVPNSHSTDDSELINATLPTANINNTTVINENQHFNQARNSMIERAVAGQEETEPNIIVQASCSGTKKYSCGLCGKKVAKMARHLLSVHKSDDRVKKVSAYKPKDPTRKAMLNYLRNEGTFKANRFGTEKDRLREVSRRPNIEKMVSASDFLYCPNCLASIRRSTFAVHLKACTGKAINGRKTPQQAARKLADDCHPRISKSLRHILSVLDPDKIGKFAKLDELIIIYGNLLAVEYKPERNYDMVRQRLRLLARLVLAANSLNAGIEQLKTLIHPKNFDTCLEAVNLVAGLNADGTSYHAPATAAALGTLLNDVSNVLICEYLKETEREEKEDVKDFQRLLNRSWNAKVSKRVRETQQKNRRQTVVELPTLDDVMCLMTF